MKTWLLLFAFLVAGVGCPVAAAASDTSGPARPLNILWLIGDDLGVELGCYGDRVAQTPQLDRLAAEGVRYTHFYTTAPVCSASRSAFMTGMFARSIAAQHHRTAEPDKRPLPDGVRLLTAWFRDAGYFTANIVQFPAELGIRGTGKTDWNFRFEKPAFDGSRWSELRSRQPFFAQVNFKEPHRAFTSPGKTDPAKVVIPPYYPDTPVTRADWAAYLDSVAELDRKVGLVLKRLEDDGLADSTVVVFFGDNGRPHVRDKQFCYEEGLRVPLIIRWPKALATVVRPGTTDDRLLTAIDLAPTMLALAGLPVPPKMQGQVFLGPHAAAPYPIVFGARDRCDETELTIRTARDPRYRYILNVDAEKPLLSPNKYKETQYPAWNLIRELDAAGKLTPAQANLYGPHRPTEELYDLTADPDELHNLAHDPARRADLERLRAALNQWRATIGDLPAGAVTAR